MKKAWMAALVAVCVAGAAAAGEGGPHKRVIMKHGPGHGSVQHLAMENILVELVSAKTGKSAGEVRSAFVEAHPPAAFEALGLAEADMQPLLEEAHATLVAKALAAGLITAEQADKARAAKPILRRHIHHADGS